MSVYVLTSLTAGKAVLTSIGMCLHEPGLDAFRGIGKRPDRFVSLAAFRPDGLLDKEQTEADKWPTPEKASSDSICAATGDGE